MVNPKGRPKKDPAETKALSLDVRIEPAERQAFKDAAAVCGMKLSAWVRDRLRTAASKELGDANHPVAFLAHESRDV